MKWLVKVAKVVLRSLRKVLPKVKKEMDKVVSAVENRMHDALLKAKNSVVIRRNQLVVRSITEKSRHELNGVVQNLDHRDLPPNMEDSPLITAATHRFNCQSE